MGILAAWEALLDAVVPLRERGKRVRDLAPEDIPILPTTHELLGMRITTLMDYGHEDTAALIQSLKYDGSGYAARLLSSAMTDYLREEIASHKSFSQKKILLVPVPLHASRKRERGFNQIEQVLKHLPAEFRDGAISFLSPSALERTRPTKQQTRLHRSERLSNVAGAFTCTDENAVRGAHIFLIDDVTTTGATLANAATPLRRAGAEVSLLALSRA